MKDKLKKMEIEIENIVKDDCFLETFLKMGKDGVYKDGYETPIDDIKKNYGDKGVFIYKLYVFNDYLCDFIETL